MRNVTAVDLFAGAGGWTEGATQAGVTVLDAANHWPPAVETHSRNHPATRHHCQDLALMDPRQLADHDLLLASPACQGHTDARGKDRPHHDASRSTAWCVIDVAEVKRPEKLLVENVTEFVTKWALFPSWCDALERLGYALEIHMFDAADFGVPQNRERAIISGVRRTRHGHRQQRRRGKGAGIRLRSPALPHVPFAGMLDTDGAWSPVEGHAPKTLARIANGRRQFGSRFLAPYYGSGSGLTGRSLDRPIGTVTTVDRYALVDGDQMRMLSIAEYLRAQSFRPDYWLAGNHKVQLKQIGNAVPPLMARELVRQMVAA